jgi:hypothetical protein
MLAIALATETSKPLTVAGGSIKTITKGEVVDGSSEKA